MRHWKRSFGPWGPGSGGKRHEAIHRPLIPLLISFMGGILIGHMWLPHLQPLIVPLLILITSVLILSLFTPLFSKLPLFIIIFLFAGILLTLASDRPSELSSLTHEREKVIMEGTVLKPASTTRDRTRFELMAERLFIHGQVRKLGERVLVTVYNHTRDFSTGERIRFPARLRRFENFNNPGRYDYELSMRLRGISCAASVSDGKYVIPMGKGHLALPVAMMESFRKAVRDLFRWNLSAQNYALYRALILGERQGIDPKLREHFNIAGLGHILAVSGLHIGIIAWLAFLVSKRILSFSYSLTLKYDIRRIAAIVTCFTVIFYTWLAGFQVSGQRAMIMALTYLFSIVLGREKETWSTLALAALIVLALNPNALFSISFQLSFIAVTGILWLAPELHKRIPEPFARPGQMNIFHRLYIHITGLIVVTISATVFLLPVTSFYFHRVSIVSIAANLTVVPLMGIWVLPLGLLSATCIHLSPSLATFFLQMGAWGLRWMMDIIRFWSSFDWASFWVVTPNGFEIILFYSLIFFLFFIRRRQWAKIGLLIAVIAVIADSSYWIYQTRFNSQFRVTFLDVGQGSATLIQFPGRQRMLIDGGGFPRGSFDVGRMVVGPTLFHSKILRIDYLVLTHPQSDHMNGLRFIAANFHPREFWHNGDMVETRSFKELIQILESKQTEIFLPANLSNGRDISGVRIDLLHPPPGRKAAGLGLNNNSLVIKLSYQGRSILFPGDIEMYGEKMVVSNAGPALRSDIMLAPHHGSKGSSTRQFLRMVRPEICVISSGRGNYFGFPHTQTLERLKEIGCKVIRINQKGAVQLSMGQDGFEISTFLE